MKKTGTTVIVLSSVCLCVILFINMTHPQTSPETITHAEIRTIMPPVAGHYPSSFFMNPYKPGTNIKNNFTQTLIWEPQITRTFALYRFYCCNKPNLNKAQEILHTQSFNLNPVQFCGNKVTASGHFLTQNCFVQVLNDDIIIS